MKHIYWLLILPALLSVGCDDLVERDIEGRTVSVVAPRDGVRTVAGEVTFLWRPLDGARSYHLTIVSPSFARAARVVADTTLAVDLLSAGNRFVQAIEAGDYEWSIRAANGGYRSAELILSLTVDAAEPEEPERPTDPTEPTNPTDPEVPTEPTEPVGPEPEEPGEPNGQAAQETVSGQSHAEQSYPDIGSERSGDLRHISDPAVHDVHAMSYRFCEP
ncbi:MAG: hypothetical protein IJC16_07730 [Rikenellaceae bacterium]|nr:hypothetical protein [Rikenellaceae bacterium]